MSDSLFIAERAVADVVGNILLVAVTVVAMTGFAGVLFAIDRPHAALRPDLDISTSPGDGTWGDGNEQVILHHLGGDPLPRDRTRIVLQIDDVHQNHHGLMLGDGFTDGRLSTGERWAWTGQIPGDAEIALDVVDVEARQIVATHLISRGTGGSL